MKRILMGLIIAGLLSSCGNKSESGRFRERGTPQNPILVNTCQGNQLSARITAAMGHNFQQAVAGLVSATMDPSTLGQVSGQSSGPTGVELRLTLALNASKSIEPSGSQFQLIITDTWVGQTGTDGQKIDPIYIVHTAESTLQGGWDQHSQEYRILFEDKFGEILIRYRLQGAYVVGQVEYQNKTSWNGSAPQSGLLGEFSAAATQCGF